MATTWTRDVFRRGLGELTDVYEIVLGKVAGFKITPSKVVLNIARAGNKGIRIDG